MSTPDDGAVAAGHSVDAASWRVLFDDLIFLFAGRFARVEPRRTAREVVLGLCEPAVTPTALTRHADGAATLFHYRNFKLLPLKAEYYAMVMRVWLWGRVQQHVRQPVRPAPFGDASIRLPTCGNDPHRPSWLEFASRGVGHSPLGA